MPIRESCKWSCVLPQAQTHSDKHSKRVTIYGCDTVRFPIALLNSVETPFSHSVNHSLTHIRLVFLNHRSRKRITIRFTVWPFSSVLWRRALWDNVQLSWYRPHRYSSRMGNSSPARKRAQGLMPYLQGVIIPYSNQAIPQPMRWWRSWLLCWIPWGGKGGCGIVTSFVWFFCLGNG